MAARTQKRCIELVRTQPPRRVEPMRQVGIVGERVQQALDIVAVGAPDRATLHVSRVHVAAGWDRRGHVEMWAWQVANGCGEQGCQGRWGAGLSRTVGSVRARHPHKVGADRPAIVHIILAVGHGLCVAARVWEGRVRRGAHTSK